MVTPANYRSPYAAPFEFCLSLYSILNTPYSQIIPQGLFELPHHLYQIPDDDLRGILLYLVRPQPGLVTAQLMLRRRRQITMFTVTQADHDGPAKGTLLLQLQSGLSKGLKGNPPRAKRAAFDQI